MAANLYEKVGLLLHEGLSGQPHPMFPGAVCGLDDGNEITVLSCGDAYRYADADGTPLPSGEVCRMSDDTLFDLASVTKLFTATVVVRCAAEGLLDLDEPVGRHLPSYAKGEKARVTARHLLTHMSGLPAEIFFWQLRGSDQARRAAVLAQPLEAQPGERFCYSCVGYITLGFLVEQVTGRSLEEVVDDWICAPLGLNSTGYLPLQRAGDRDPAGFRRTIAASEMRRITWARVHDPDDPDVRGIVHDENAAALGGVSGNAGIFSSARDLLAFGRAYLTAVTSAPRSPLGLARSTARELVRPQLPAGLEVEFQSGLGFRIDDETFMGRLIGTGQAYGHPGFTGTSLVIDERRDLVLVLLTNRVHPNRTWSELNPFRRRLADLVAADYGISEPRSNRSSSSLTVSSLGDDHAGPLQLSLDPEPFDVPLEAR
jgi:CubicO group peptidase (beta-lactamase class C family)